MKKIVDFFNLIITHKNAINNYGDTISDKAIVEKILWTITPKFDNIMVPIKESKKIEEMKVEDLQGSLEAHEQRITERSTKKCSDN